MPRPRQVAARKVFDPLLAIGGGPLGGAAVGGLQKLGGHMSGTLNWASIRGVGHRFGGPGGDALKGDAFQQLFIPYSKSFLSSPPCDDRAMYICEYI